MRKDSTKNRATTKRARPGARKQLTGVVFADLFETASRGRICAREYMERLYPLLCAINLQKLGRSIAEGSERGSMACYYEFNRQLEDARALVILEDVPPELAAALEPILIELAKTA